MEDAVTPGRWSHELYLALSKGVAATYYREVLKYPAPKNELFGDAAYALGIIYANLD